MEKRKPSVRFTNHAVDRFKERFPQLIEDSPTKALACHFYAAQTDNSFKNNSLFMMKLGEKYGYDAVFDFRVTDDIVFVVRERRLITLFGRQDSIFGSSRRSRFRRT